MLASSQIGPKWGPIRRTQTHTHAQLDCCKWPIGFGPWFSTFLGEKTPSGPGKNQTECVSFPEKVFFLWHILHPHKKKLAFPPSHFRSKIKLPPTLATKFISPLGWVSMWGVKKNTHTHTVMCRLSHPHHRTQNDDLRNSPEGYLPNWNHISCKSFPQNYTPGRKKASRGYLSLLLLVSFSSTSLLHPLRLWGRLGELSWREFAKLLKFRNCWVFRCFLNDGIIQHKIFGNVSNASEIRCWIN